MNDASKSAVGRQGASPPLFDAYSQNYDEVLNAAIRISGETRQYFARGRLAWLARRLATRRASPARVLDFGCGTGAAVGLFFELLGAESVCGVDVSAASLEVARRATADSRARFVHADDYQPSGEVDLAFCNGVFHHIAPRERASTLEHIYRALAPGGWFAFWENNPWNPGAVYCMRRNPFDREAHMISPAHAPRLLRSAGFEVAETTYAFFFPRALRSLRRLEARLHWLPFGAQYMVLARKPERAPTAKGSRLATAIRQPGDDATETS